MPVSRSGRSATSAAAFGSRTMLDRRPFRLDLAACALLAAGLFVALCVFGHEPLAVRSTAHMLGPLGDTIGKLLADVLGVAVYVLLASWFVLVVALFLRKTWFTWSLR